MSSHGRSIGCQCLCELGEDFFGPLISEYQHRRDLVFAELQKIPGIVCVQPQGAFYIIAKLPIVDAEDFVIWLLNNFDIDGETVMAAPRKAFMPPPDWAETSFAWPIF